MAGGFEMFDCPVGKNDSELDCVLSFLTQRLVESPHSLCRDRLDESVAAQFPGRGGPAADQSPKFGNFPPTNRQAAVALKTTVPVWLSRCASAR